MKRFYTSVDIASEDSAYTVLLDGRQMLTPKKSKLTLPTKLLAQSVSREWADAGDTIVPEDMVFTRLSNTAIDRCIPLKADVIAELTKFAETDLVCYRAETPTRLIALQAQHWDAVQTWLSAECGIAMTATTGLIGHCQPPEALAAISQRLSALTPFELVAMHGLTTASGSVSIAMAHGFGPFTAEQAWAAAIVDETFQMSEWGEDKDALDALSQKHQDFLAASRFWSILRNDI